MKPTDDYDIKVETDMSSLTFSEIYSDDEGEYKVEISNRNGTCISSAFITVKREYQILICNFSCKTETICVAVWEKCRRDAKPVIEENHQQSQGSKLD